MTVTIFQLRDREIPRDAYLSVRFPLPPDGVGESEARAEAARALLASGGYEAVAEVVGTDDPEDAWHKTQNGVASMSWSRLPPEGVRLIGDGAVSFRGRTGGRRTSDIGDLFVVDGARWFVCDRFGFTEVGANLLAEIPRGREADESRGRVHIEMCEQEDILADVVETCMDDRAALPGPTAAPLLAERGIAPDLTPVFASLAENLLENPNNARAFLDEVRGRSRSAGRAP